MNNANEINEVNNLAKTLIYYNLIYDISSANQKIICPFHADVNPSMLVDLENNKFYCFGCNLSGDTIKFIRLIEEQINPENEIKDIDVYKKYFKILKSKGKGNYNLNKEICVKTLVDNAELFDESYNYYFGLKTINWAISTDKGITEALEYITKRGFNPSTLNECKAKLNYNNSYKLIFPMFDNGEFKGWICRTTKKEVEKKRKYLYNKGFSRANTLVGDYGKKDYIFIVEGYMDRLKFLQFGENNVVAILGWKMSQNQIQKLQDTGVKYVISALDNDDVGKKGTEFLRQYFEVIRFTYLKNVKDPGEMDKISFDKMYNKTMNKFNELKEKESDGINRQNKKRYSKNRA